MIGFRSPGARPSESIAGKVLAVVSRMCGRGITSDQLDLSRDLHLDSADRAELLMAVELAFRIDFSASETAAISTVSDLIATVTKKARSVEPTIGSREALLEAIRDLAAGAANANEAIDIVAAANALVASYPQTGLTVDEISEQIEEAAIAAGAVTLLNGRRHSA